MDLFVQNLKLPVFMMNFEICMFTYPYTEYPWVYVTL